MVPVMVAYGRIQPPINCSDMSENLLERGLSTGHRCQTSVYTEPSSRKPRNLVDTTAELGK